MEGPVDSFSLLMARKRTPLNPRKPQQRLGAMATFEQEDPEAKRAVLAKAKSDDGKRARKLAATSSETLGGRHVITIESGNSTQFPQEGELINISAESEATGVDAPDGVLLNAQKMAIENLLELCTERGKTRNEHALNAVRSQRKLDRPPTSLEMRSARAAAPPRTGSRAPVSYDEPSEDDLTSDY